jgi:hypothetical protein
MLMSKIWSKRMIRNKWGSKKPILPKRWRKEKSIKTERCFWYGERCYRLRDPNWEVTPTFIQKKGEWVFSSSVWRPKNKGK